MIYLHIYLLLSFVFVEVDLLSNNDTEWTDVWLSWFLFWLVPVYWGLNKIFRWVR